MYGPIGKDFASHATVNHSAGEYIRTGGFHHTNTVESHFALLKRGFYGTFHNISEAHLGRYLTEFDFRANTRHLTDAERQRRDLDGRQRQASDVSTACKRARTLTGFAQLLKRLKRIGTVGPNMTPEPGPPTYFYQKVSGAI